MALVAGATRAEDHAGRVDLAVAAVDRAARAASPEVDVAVVRPVTPTVDGAVGPPVWIGDPVLTGVPIGSAVLLQLPTGVLTGRRESVPSGSRNRGWPGSGAPSGVPTSDRSRSI